MAKAKENSNGSGVEPIEEPSGTVRAENVGTRWVTGEIDKQ